MFDFSKIERLRSKADHGDASCQIELGNMYLKGQSIQASFTKAYAYFAMAARQNHPEGLYRVAECQDSGTGTPANPSNAFQNFQKAANLGHLQAILSLAHYHETGRAGVVDHDKAIFWYQEAINKGHQGSKVGLERVLKAKTQGALSAKSPVASPNQGSKQRPLTGKEDIKIEDIPFFRGLGAMELIFMMGIVSNIKGKRGQFLFCEGQEPNGLFVVLSGQCSVRLTNLNSSTFTEVKIVGPGDYVGEFGLIDGLPRSATVIVTEDAELMFLPTSAFQATIESQKNVAEVVTKNLASMIRDGNLIIKQKDAKHLVYSGAYIAPTLENMKTLVGILRASNSTEQTDYWDR